MRFLFTVTFSFPENECKSVLFSKSLLPKVQQLTD